MQEKSPRTVCTALGETRTKEKNDLRRHGVRQSMHACIFLVKALTNMYVQQTTPTCGPLGASNRPPRKKKEQGGGETTDPHRWRGNGAWMQLRI